MLPDPKRVKELFREAVALPPDVRDEFLQTACGDHAALRRRVEELLASHAGAGPFLARPLRQPAANPGPDDPTPAVSRRLDAPGPYRRGTRLGRYTLREVIGEGGMGTVWAAEQTDPFVRVVALKLIKPGMDSGAVLARFGVERQALALMDHPNIARVLDAGDTPQGHPFFVMELVSGSPLTAFCDERRLSVRKRLGLFVSVCRAVQHAHQKGVVHRDLKPSNVLVAEQDGEAVPKVIDFGIAKALRPATSDLLGTTGFGGVVGTPEYMSPEQADTTAADIDTRADVYSLGALLYELLVGTPPLDRGDLASLPFTEVLRRVKEQTPPRPSARLAASPAAVAIAAARGTEPGRLVRDLRRELDWVVMKALEKDRDRRYESAGELAADVQRYLNREPVAARPPGVGYRLGTFVRRNRAAVAAVSLVVLALAGGLTGTTLGMLRARDAERVAVAARENEEGLRLTATEERDRANRAAAEARESEVTVRTVLGFVGERVFAAGRIEGVEGGLGLDVSLRRAIDEAERHMPAAFRDRPLAEAHFRRLIGRTLGMGGEPRRSVAQYEAALRLYETHLGPDHPDTLLTRSDLAVAYRFVDRRAEALDALARVAPALCAKLGPDHPDAVRAVLRLGSAHTDVGQYAEAVRIIEAEVGRLRDRLGPNHPTTLTAERRLASAYHGAGRSDEAIQLLERLVERLTRDHGPDHPLSLEYAVTLAGMYADTRQPGRAVSVLVQALPKLEERLGRDHPAVLESAGRLAKLHGESGRPADALAILDRVVPRVKAKLGPEHPMTLAALHDLAVTYVKLGRRSEAKATLLELVELLVKHPRIPPAARAGEVHRAALLLVSIDEPAAAESVLRPFLAARETAGADGWETGQTRCLIGFALLRQGRYEDAEPLLLAGYDELKRCERPAGPDEVSPVVHATRAIAELYAAWGKPDQAREWRARLPAHAR